MTGKPHVMFVDDEPRILDGLRRMLRTERTRWDISFAPGGAEALEAMRDRPCDVVVTDFRMPGMDGGDLLNEVRSRYPGTARVILSGQTGEDNVLRVVALSHQFLSKPTSREQLVQTVDRLLAAQAASGDDSARRDASIVQSLPSAPAILPELIRALDAEDSSAGSIAAVVERDPAAAAKVLQLANSSASMVGQQISNVSQAVALLGPPTVRGLVLMHDVVRSLDPAGLLPARWIQELSDHSVRTSHLARLLAGGAPWEHEAFTAGLLHEVGQLVLASSRGDGYPAVLAVWADGGAPEPATLDAAETSAFGTCHSEAGANLLQLWGLPAQVVSAVAEHASADTWQKVHDATSAVALAHRVVEAEFGPMCDAPGHQERLAEQDLGPAEREAVDRWRASLTR
ncbi:two-component system response regulator [Paractinoplanes deccanensis]|uniref:Two-component system response regulator n=1 Tax=Paractinoplanes deccanensis TaxID=113561 RepID=A0ABQ3Y4P4_9ACTN|nr:HDOD domain-containing protein [Actinoplanes deccanensis]GID74950.1 two-component system response regulator [Actinoplanes deccanensis]